MKRTPLKRRTRMRRMSRKKEETYKAYLQVIGMMRKTTVEYWDRGATGAIFKMVGKCHRGLDPHHPFGRKGELVMMFVWVTRRFHDWIHGEGRKEAMRLGWLQPEFEARPHDPNHPRPWET